MTSTPATGIGQVSLCEVELGQVTLCELDLGEGKEHLGELRAPASGHATAAVIVPTAAAFIDSLQALKASPAMEITRSNGDHTVSLRDVELALQETREQRELRIRNLFDRFDTDKTGYVDHEQIKSGFKTLSIPSDNKYAKDLLLVCDANCDGKVDFDEFKRYMDAKELELYLMFQELDVKHNGVLQLEELRAALRGAGVDVKDENLATFVDHIDLDRNGVISFSEWRDFLLLYPHEATLKNIYQYWEKICLVDIGESAVIPEGISRHLHAYKYLIAGGVAGAISRTATAPLDRLKVLLQVQTEAPTKSGVIGGLRQMYHEGGAVAFFRGNGINILKVAPESAIKFYSFEIMKELVVGSDANGKMNEIGAGGRLLAGGTAGAIAQTAIYPMDLVKTRLQTFSCQNGGRPPPLMTLSKDILVHEGPRAFYRGLVPSLLGMVPYAGIDLAAYESLKDFSHRYIGEDSDPGPFIQLGCGTISGALGATCVYPLQLIRTRLQAQALNSPDRYTGMTDVFLRTLKREGVKGFYKGLLPNLLKVVPAASITYMVYEKMKKTLSIN